MVLCKRLGAALSLEEESKEAGPALGIGTFNASGDSGGTNTAKILLEMNINEKKEIVRHAELETLLWLLGFN